MTPSNWINYLAPASGPPPSTVMAFFRWALAGSMPALWLSGLASVLAGVVEVSAVLMLGVLVDAALATSPQNPMSNQVWLLVAGVAFFLLARPVIFGVFSFVQSVVVTPNVFNLVLSRLHRWTLWVNQSGFLIMILLDVLRKKKCKPPAQLPMWWLKWCIRFCLHWRPLSGLR